MDYAFATLFVVLCGLTLSGFAASLMELFTARPVVLAPPYVSRDRFWLSILACLLAGPMMLGNETLQRSRGQLSLAALALVVLAVVWCAALGWLLLVATSMAIAPL